MISKPSSMKHNTTKVAWPILKALHDLYTKGSTKAKIQKDNYVAYLLEQKNVIAQKIGNNTVLVPLEDFDAFYEQEFLQAYQHYYNFLEMAGISTDARKTFTEEDIRTLMMIYESRHQLKQNLTNIEDFSGKVFDYAGSKYLKFKDSVRNAVLTILDIAEFPNTQKDLQYRLVVDYTHPRAIILCENKSFLKQPWNAKELQVKLWYVGGNNVNIIEDIDEIERCYTFYYSCDWDFAGLDIYQRLKNKLKKRGIALNLLQPPPPRQLLRIDSFKHHSRWNNQKPLSGLIESNFSTAAITLIKELIETDCWIEEESLVLKELYLFNTNSD